MKVDVTTCSYRLFDLVVELPLALSERFNHVVSEAAPSDVQMRADEALRLGEPDQGIQFARLGKVDYRITWSDYMVARVSDGTRVVYHSRDDLREGELVWVQQCLLGPPLALVLHQRGDLVLHASAIDIDGHVAVLMGYKGGGKSTLTAAACQAGFPLQSDDVVVLDPVNNAGDAYTSRPGMPQIRLWPNSIEALQIPLDETVLIHSGGKKRIWLQPPCVYEPLPAKMLVFLQRGEEVGIERLYGREAFSVVASQLYAPRFAGDTLQSPEFFAAIAHLVRAVPVFRLTRTTSLDDLPRVLDTLMTTAAKL